MAASPQPALLPTIKVAGAAQLDVHTTLLGMQLTLPVVQTTQLVVQSTQLVVQPTQPVAPSTQPVVQPKHPVEEPTLPVAVPSQQPDSPTHPMQLTAWQVRKHILPASWPAADSGPAVIMPLGGPETLALLAQVNHLEGLVTALSTKVSTL